MAKKRRLGSDPLSWINNSRQEKPTEDQIMVDEKKIELPFDEMKTIPTRSSEETPSTSEMPDEETIQSQAQTENKELIPQSEKQIQTQNDKTLPELDEPEIEPPEPVTVVGTGEVPTEPEPEEINFDQASIELPEEDQLLTDPIFVPFTAKSMPASASALKNEPAYISQEAPLIAEDVPEKQFEKAAPIRVGKYLTFYMADEEYAIEILKVQEIIGILPITPVPNTVNYIRGVINLRGQVIPVMELRIKFGMDLVEYTEQSCIIVVQSQGNRIGIIVDKVSEVIRFAADDIDDTPSFGNALIDTQYILGVGKSDGHIKLLLDIDKVLQIIHD